MPNNFLGFQHALSGVAYCGVWSASYETTETYREYLSVPLIKPLIKDSCYYFQMYVNLADHSEFATDDFGAYFSTTIISGVNNSDALPFIPQVSNPQGNILNDTLHWVLISGYFRALGGEIQLIIGNFNNEGNTTRVHVPYPVGFNPYAYYFVDSVSLIQVPNCTTDLSDFAANAFIKLYPNPVTDELNITNNKDEFSEIILYDILSNKITQKEFGYSTSLNMKQLKNGIYLYEMRINNSLIKRGKVVKK